MNLYEWCFETYLVHRRQRFWRIRDLDQAVLDRGPTKNFDYLVQRDGTSAALVEIKGRSFPTANGGKWENWVTRSDLDALVEWSRVFGPGTVGLFVFMYRLTKDYVVPCRAWTPITLEEKRFGAVAVDAETYARHCRPRSVKWNTLTVPRQAFPMIARPLAEWLPAGRAESRGSVGRSA